jgi:4-hydroxy-tetrahydrodipicolinate reductase
VAAPRRGHVIRVCVAGVTGWTGRAVAEAVEAAADLELVSGVSRFTPASFSSVEEALDAVATDVLVDYTHAAVVRENVLAAIERSVGVVIGSSGLSAADYAEIDAQAQEKRVGVIAAGNFSLTAALLLRFAAEAARHLEAWEVIDYASTGKQDAPSGTSRELAERLEGAGAPALGVPLDETHGARRREARPWRARRCTRSGCPASPSRPRLSLLPRASGSRSATTLARAPRRMSPAQ